MQEDKHFIPKRDKTDLVENRNELLKTLPKAFSETYIPSGQVQEMINSFPQSLDFRRQSQESVKNVMEILQSSFSVQDSVLKSIESVQKIVVSQLPTMEQIRVAYNKIANIILDNLKIDVSKISESADRIIKEISNSLSKIQVPTISEEEKQNYIEANKQWGEFGWTINPIENIEALFHMPPADKKSADAIANKQCSKENMQELFRITLDTRRVKKSDFTEAVSDFEQRRFKSCALILFSLIDSMLIRLQKRSELNGKRRGVGKRAIDAAFERTEAELNTEMFNTAMFCTNLFACLRKVYEDGGDFKRQPEVINRNFLSHGMLSRRVTRKNCVQLFLLYYNMLELLDLIYERGKEIKIKFEDRIGE